MEKIIECVPNFSEGRDLAKVEKIVDCFRNKKDLKLIDYSSDSRYNRSVITCLGTLESIKQAIVAATKQTTLLINMEKNNGEHPKIGAMDVIPFIPIKNISIEEVVEFSKEVAKEIAEKFNIPTYLYEKSASCKERENLANIRKGNYENFAKKMKDKKWKPDYGPLIFNKKTGATVIGAREILVAYNIALDTFNIKIARKIAILIRESSGGFKYCKAIGVVIENEKKVHVSINITNYKKLPLYIVYEAVKKYAKQYDVEILYSELIGTPPVDLFIESSKYYFKLKNFKNKNYLENYL